MSSLLSDYDPFLVGLSFAVAIIGSFASLRLARVIPRRSPEGRLPWVLGAGFALGSGGIWSMHFIGMLALDLGMRVSYDLPLTFLSLLLAWVVASLGFHVVSRKPGLRVALLVAGAIMGSGVAAMHYTGMAAMQMAAAARYHPGLVLVSGLIAIVTSTVALWLAFKVSTNVQMMMASMVMGIGICGMHYTGMAAVRWTPRVVDAVPKALPFSDDVVAYAISFLILVLLVVGLVLGSEGRYEAAGR